MGVLVNNYYDIIIISRTECTSAVVYVTFGQLVLQLLVAVGVRVHVTQFSEFTECCVVYSLLAHIQLFFVEDMSLIDMYQCLENGWHFRIKIDFLCGHFIIPCALYSPCLYRCVCCIHLVTCRYDGPAHFFTIDQWSGRTGDNYGRRDG